MANNKKIDEALSHIKEAEKALKTGLLKWKPDYDSAADEYNTAARCYKGAKQFVQCRECLLKAAENYKICGTYFSAAKCTEQAGYISRDIGEFDKVASHIEHAALIYRDHGNKDSGASALEKGSKMIEHELPDKAIHLYRFAVELMLMDDHFGQAAEVQSKVSRHLVRLKRLDEAVNSLRKEISIYLEAEQTTAVSRLAIVLVMVQIARGDIVAAEKAYREWGSYCEAEDAATIESMIQGFDEEDGELARRALNSPLIKYMAVEYSILARDMPTPKIKETKKSSKQDYYSGPGSATKETTECGGEDDDEELDLC